MAYLGIDLGTSGLRALLVNEEGIPIGTAEHPYQTWVDHPGWSEQTPTDWIDALKAVIGKLRQSHHEFAAIKAIGISGHMHGAVLLDKKNQVLRRCVMWNDLRSEAEAQILDQTPGVRALSGNIVFPGFTAPKLEWIRKYEYETFQNLSKVVLPSSYLSCFLTGEHVIDMSDASGTSWLDVGKREWSDFLLDAGHMRGDHMPALTEGSTPAGHLRGDLADEWGLSKSVIVTAGAGDNAAAACGVGAIEEGQGFVSLGTSGVVLVTRNRFSPMPETAIHTFCHAVPNRWLQMGVMLSATRALNWLAGICGHSPAKLSQLLGSTLQPPCHVTCLPYFSGERTPHNDANVRAAFWGISHMTTVEDLTQATMEGVAFGLRDCVEALRKTGADFRELHLVGGGAASQYWASLLATVLNVKLKVSKGGEFGAALGAARLAKMAATGKSAQEVMHIPTNSEDVRPNDDLTKDFDAAYQRFGAAYAAFREDGGGKVPPNL